MNMGAGPLWNTMHAEPRRAARELTGPDVPTGAGVYAWYRDGAAIYVGKATGADGVRGRVWKNHLQTGNDLSRSSFRRNVCELLGIAPTSRTTIRPTVMTTAEVARVNEWIRSCEVAWQLCASKAEAEDLEDRLKREWKPPLIKR